MSVKFWYQQATNSDGKTTFLVYIFFVLSFFVNFKISKLKWQTICLKKFKCECVQFQLLLFTIFLLLLQLSVILLKLRKEKSCIGCRKKEGLYALTPSFLVCSGVCANLTHNICAFTQLYRHIFTAHKSFCRNSCKT